MKKVEAIEVAKERSNLLCEFITQILTTEESAVGEFIIDSEKFPNGRMITFDLFVPKSGFERHYNTGIPVDFINILTGQILSDLIDNYMRDEELGCTKYYTLRGNSMSMNGVSVVNSTGANIRINFRYRGSEFDAQIKEYNETLNNYLNEPSGPRM